MVRTAVSSDDGALPQSLIFEQRFAQSDVAHDLHVHLHVCDAMKFRLKVVYPMHAQV